MKANIVPQRVRAECRKNPMDFLVIIFLVMAALYFLIGIVIVSPALNG